MCLNFLPEIYDHLFTLQMYFRITVHCGEPIIELIWGSDREMTKTTENTKGVNMPMNVMLKYW